MSTAICDPDAFYPLRNLVRGPFNDLSQLHEVERLIRAIVLHDEIIMEPAPLVYDELAEAEAEAQEFQAFKVNTNQSGHIVGGMTGVVAGKPLIGATTGMIVAVGKPLKDALYEVGKCLLGRGALDLANKVRIDVNCFDPKALSRILSDAEKRKLDIN